MAETQPELFEIAEVGPRFVPRTFGYVARPGTGPAGETCGTCRHLVRTWRGGVVGGSGPHCFRKCRLAEAMWTWGDRTDVRAGAPACRRRRRPKKGGRSG